MSGDERTEHLLVALAATARTRLIAERRALATTPGSRSSLEEHLRAVVEREADVLPPSLRGRVEERVRRDTIGLGPLEELLGDPRVEEVMVNGPDRVYVERRGRLEEVDDAAFDGESHLRETIDRMLAPAGRRVDELNPMADARLEDGSRVNVVIPPLSVGGASVSVRRFGRHRPSPLELVASGSLSPAAARLLRAEVRARSTILVSGGTGAGKTTLLGVLAAHVDPSDRVVTIEDAAELSLPLEHVVRLESRPASAEGRGAVTIRDLVRNALRMRPDRIIVGEVRGAEAFDLLSALNTGHRGALSTVHANSCDDALRRLETLAMMADVGLPHPVVAEQVARGVDLIVHVERGAGGERRVVEVARVAGNKHARAEPVALPSPAERAGTASAHAA